MRPIVIDMQAFGPFAARQVIDFRRLGDKRFFLIHGPTGSGKTSILDAMCFALFGDSSGGERDGAQMRSHHADVAMLTQVTFDFALGADRYRVRRTPEQMRQAKRGGGETRQAQQAELFRLDTADGTDVERPLVTGWPRVTAEVGELLGFESRQFRQVIVLPQGRFVDFLKSNTRDREAILQTLFGTELYKRIEERLSRTADDVAQQASVVRTQRQTLLDQAQTQDETTLEMRLAQLAVHLTTRRNEVQASAKTAQMAEAVLAEARKLADRFDELDKATHALQPLRAQKPEWTAKRQQFAAAQQATTIEPYAEALADIERQHTEATSRIETLQRDAKAAAQRLADTEAGLSREKARERERDEAGNKVDRLAALKGKVASLEEARTALRAAETEARKARTGQEAAEAVQKAATETHRRLEQTASEYRVLASRLDGLQATVKRLGEQSTQVSNLAKATEALKNATREGEQQTKSTTATQLAVDTARSDRDRVHAAWVAGQAARLAAELVAGEPCPVCGAHEHAAPAHVAEPLVQDDALDAAEESLAKAESAHTHAYTRLVAARQEVAVQETRIVEIRSALGAHLLSADELRAQAEAAQAELKKTEAAVTALGGVERQLPYAATTASRAEQVLKQATESAAEAQARQRQCEAIVNERQAEVPAELTDTTKLEAAMATAIDTRDALKQALDKATAAVTATATEKAKCAGQMEAAAQTLASLVEHRTARSRDLAERLQQAAFESVEAFRAARLDAVQARALDHAIKTFDANLVAAQQRHDRATADMRDHQRPDLAALVDRHEAAKAAHLAASNAVRDAVAAHDASTKLAAALKRLAGEYQALQDRYAVLKKVADLATGNNNQRLSLQRYVLATLLEEVLAAATLRLRVMSRARYELRRVPAPVDQRSASGLDLEVFDHYTGMPRAVGTLSGGESFLASLALALGLSDVVQSYSGGLRLDAIFVDEGFGTLDAEALDFAIRTLKDLQHAGRLVGIISHVGELREWIDARLEVKAGQKGSAAEFLV
jgi:exonuclease SbcC